MLLWGQTHWGHSDVSLREILHKMPSPPIPQGDFNARTFAERDRSSGIFKSDCRMTRFSATATDEPTRILKMSLRSDSLTSTGRPSSTSLRSIASGPTEIRRRSYSRPGGAPSLKSYERPTCSSRNRSCSSERGHATSSRDQSLRARRVDSGSSVTSQFNYASLSASAMPPEPWRQNRRVGSSAGCRQGSRGSSYNPSRRMPPVRPQLTKVDATRADGWTHVSLPPPRQIHGSCSFTKEAYIHDAAVEGEERKCCSLPQRGLGFWYSSAGSDGVSQVHDPLTNAITAVAEGGVDRSLENSTDGRGRFRGSEFVEQANDSLAGSNSGPHATLPSADPQSVGPIAPHLSGSSWVPSRNSRREGSVWNGYSADGLQGAPLPLADQGVKNRAPFVYAPGRERSANWLSTQNGASPPNDPIIESFGARGISEQELGSAEGGVGQVESVQGSRRGSMSCNGVARSFAKGGDVVRGALIALQWLWCWLVWMVRLLNTSYDSWAVGTAEIWVARPWAKSQKDGANRQCKKGIGGAGADDQGSEDDASLKTQSHAATSGTAASRNRQQPLSLAARIAAHSEANASRARIRAGRQLGDSVKANKSTVLNKDHYAEDAKGGGKVTALVLGVFALASLVLIQWSYRSEDEFIDVEIM